MLILNRVVNSIKFWIPINPFYPLSAFTLAPGARAGVSGEYSIISPPALRQPSLADRQPFHVTQQRPRPE